MVTMALSRSFRDKRQYLQKFSQPVHLTTPLSGFPLEFCNVGGDIKTRMMPYQNVKKCDDTLIHFDTVPALERQINGIGKTINHCACIAW